jgi:hypothetical protein
MHQPVYATPADYREFVTGVPPAEQPPSADDAALSARLVRASELIDEWLLTAHCWQRVRQWTLCHLIRLT